MSQTHTEGVSSAVMDKLKPLVKMYADRHKGKNSLKYLFLKFPHEYVLRDCIR